MQKIDTTKYWDDRSSNIHRIMYVSYALAKFVTKQEQNCYIQSQYLKMAQKKKKFANNIQIRLWLRLHDKVSIFSIPSHILYSEYEFSYPFLFFFIYNSQFAMHAFPILCLSVAAVSLHSLQLVIISHFHYTKWIWFLSQVVDAIFQFITSKINKKKKEKKNKYFGIILALECCLLLPRSDS